MKRIVNNTDLHINRLLILYGAELATIDKSKIKSIVFDSCRMLVFGIDCVLLEVDERQERYHDMCN
jgi:hypothetical protein